MPSNRHRGLEKNTSYPPHCRDVTDWRWSDERGSHALGEEKPAKCQTATCAHRQQALNLFRQHTQRARVDQTPRKRKVESARMEPM